LAQVEAVLLEESETIDQITGTGNSVTPEVEHKSADPTPEPKAAKPTPEPKAAKPEPKKEAEGVDASEPAKATAKVDDYDSIDQALDNLDFDD
jgi:hypothetical protein